jgi:hypothetical protein
MQVLNAFGFSLGFCKLISNCVSSSWFSVVMNGTSKGFFKACRGLRQGDPLSPYLLILVEEVFSRLLRKKVQDGTIGHYLQPRKGPLISHLLYADDMVIFSTGRKKDVRSILEVLDIYAQWSGQVVNASKSSIFFSNRIPDSRHQELIRISGFSIGNFPTRYLGVPIFPGRVKAWYFEDLLVKIYKKIEGWKMRYLSAGARLLLIKHVLSSLPVHLLSVLPVPKQIFGKINRLFSTFFWGASEGRPKRKWVSWDSVCRPVDEGSVRIRNIMDVYSSLQSKFSWKFLSEDTLWSRFFKAKYVKNQHISLVDSSKGSRFWKVLINSVPLVIDKSVWHVKDGNLYFWRDKWMDSGPICQKVQISNLLLLKIKDCMVEHNWDVDLVVQLVGQEIADDIFFSG